MNMISETSPLTVARPLDTESPAATAPTASAPILAHAQRITGVDDVMVADMDHVRATLRRRAALTPGYLGAIPADSLHPEVELSLWRSPLSVRAYTHAGRPELVDLRRRGRPAQITVERVLWWLTEDREPTPAEAAARLEHLRRHGPGPEGFTLRSPVPPAAALGR